MKKINGFWTDSNRNKWNCELYTKAQAIKYSESLTGCVNCSDLSKITISMRQSEQQVIDNARHWIREHQQIKHQLENMTIIRSFIHIKIMNNGRLDFIIYDTAKKEFTSVEIGFSKLTESENSDIICKKVLKL